VSARVLGVRGHPWRLWAAYLVATVGGLAIAAVMAPFRDTLSHTLTAPLRTFDGVIGAIVLSRREASAWPESGPKAPSMTARNAANPATCSIWPGSSSWLTMYSTSSAAMP